MLDINVYMQQLIQRLQAAFGNRLCYVGLQGSYLRGEAHEHSDIDAMVILETLTVEDMDRYREILVDLGHYDLSCGFICGKQEMKNWNALELCHLLHTTKDCYGNLADFVCTYTQSDVIQYTKMSLNNLYHFLCHSYIHSGKNSAYEMLPGMYKGAFFILQSLQYLKSGEYALTKRQLLEQLEGMDREVLQKSLMPEDPQLQTDEAFRLLLDWCSSHIQRL